MDVLLCLAGLAFSIWVVFFNGAEVLEGSFLGYHEFGPFAEKAKYIKAAGWVGLVVTVIGVLHLSFQST